ncbi:hypothetical protein [Paraflavitalea speifideaquila]|uniref:hypothetical protein n=1 Tax=Paraflavitalea speifideaquila TaxID=3076558 RepID=UPI0028E5E451|nr:hypothetical protein [Paraflavitalea speifideiaquila]
MDFNLMTGEHTAVAYSPTIPSSLARFHVPGARELYATGDFGALLFYEQAGPDFSFWYKSYFIKQSTFLSAVAEAPLFQLCFSINRTLRFQQQGMGKTRLPQGQFNILYAPAILNQTWFDKGKNTWCMIFTFPAATWKSCSRIFPTWPNSLLRPNWVYLAS